MDKLDGAAITEHRTGSTWRRRQTQATPRHPATHTCTVTQRHTHLGCGKASHARQKSGTDPTSAARTRASRYESPPLCARNTHRLQWRASGCAVAALMLQNPARGQLPCGVVSRDKKMALAEAFSGYSQVRLYGQFGCCSGLSRAVGVSFGACAAVGRRTWVW